MRRRSGPCTWILSHIAILFQFSAISDGNSALNPPLRPPHFLRHSQIGSDPLMATAGIAAARIHMAGQIAIKPQPSGGYPSGAPSSSPPAFGASQEGSKTGATTIEEEIRRNGVVLFAFGANDAGQLCVGDNLARRNPSMVRLHATLPPDKPWCSGALMCGRWRVESPSKMQTAAESRSWALPSLQSLLADTTLSSWTCRCWRP